MNKLKEKILLRLSNAERKSLIFILSEFIESHKDAGSIYNQDIDTAKIMIGALIE